MTIDIHSHFVPERWPDLCERFGTRDWPWIRHTGPRHAVVMLGDREFRPIDSACWDPVVRLEHMDRDGIDVQIISAMPLFFAYERPAADALESARIFNDLALELSERGRGRLKALCQVPLQDVDASCRELERSVRSGHLGVQIGNHVGLKNLDDEGIIGFLQHCADLDVPVLVHPWDMMAPERTARYMMGWTVGMPAETELAIVSLILGGAFERLPRHLRLCFVHGGGSFAFLLGRLDNTWRRRDIARGNAPKPPSEYVDRFSVDSAVFDPRALRYLVDIMGDDRVMLGSDYPFPLGEEQVGRLVRESAFSPATRSKLLGANAHRFLGLSG